MFEIQPVRKSRGGPDRLVVLLVLFVVTGLAVAVLKPWEQARAPQLALASPLGTIVPSPTAAPPGSYRNYSTRLFGEYPRPPAYELWPAGYVVTYGISRQLPFRPAPPPAGGVDAAGALDLGPSGIVVALGINHPAEITLRGVRLWRFGGASPPARLAIASLPSPFDLPTFQVIGIPGPAASGSLVKWPPGLYRLDLLTSVSGDIIRQPRVVSVSLKVDRNYGAPSEGSDAGAGTDGAGPTVDAAALMQAARPDSMLAFGSGGIEVNILGSAAGGQANCDLAETWAAALTGDPACRPLLPLHQVAALAYAPGPGAAIRAAGLFRLDPLAGPVATRRLSALPDLAALVSADGRPFAEGTYRLDVTLRDGQTRSWYLQVVGGDGVIPDGYPLTSAGSIVDESPLPGGGVKPGAAGNH